MSESTEQAQNNITISDQPAAKDSLGLTPYVIAMTEFLTHSDTKPPLTISIEGEWGSGKSSFMKQLEEQIKVKSQEVRQEELKKVWSKIKKEHITSDLSDIGKFLQLKFGQETQTVWFNAWRHEKAESLWATFAISFLEEISRNRDFRDWIPNLYSSLLLFGKRLDFKEKPLKVFDTVVSSSVIVSIIVAFIYVGFFKVGYSGISNFSEQLVEIIEKSEKSKDTDKEEKKDSQPKNQENKQDKQNQQPKKTADKGEKKDDKKSDNKNADSLLTLSLLVGGAGGSLAGVGKLLAKLKELIGDPKMDLTQYLESPDYKNQVAFVEKFHEDFRKIVEAYIGTDEKVYVFIDDLDRCELGKAADLLQALNMMISNDPQIIFILGMDREKVAAGITYKQKNVLPYLASIRGNKQDPTENYNLSNKLDYGFSYLEKFVQLSFTLPKPSENSLNDFFTKLYHNNHENNEKTFFGIPYSFFTEIINKIPNKSSQTNSEPVPEPTTPKRPDLAIFPIIKKDLDNNAEAEIQKMVAPFFDNNPRRLKQYINGLRLKRYMYYYSIGVTWQQEKEQITEQQLAKFVAITLKYPRLLHELEQNNNLLSDLEQYAIDQSQGAVNNQGNTNYKNAESWVKTYPQLADLLCYGIITETIQQYDKNNAEHRYSFKNEEIKKLLEVSPQSELDSKYFQLWEFLEAKKWKEADQETLNVMLKVANREKQRYLDIEDIDKFPCHDLHIIDQLWVKYSEGGFGFSVQKDIYQKNELGAQKEYNEKIMKWFEFCDEVGWRKDGSWLIYEEQTFTPDKLVGHLPLRVYLIHGLP